jgi:hypothetical protein
MRLQKNASWRVRWKRPQKPLVWGDLVIVTAASAGSLASQANIVELFGQRQHLTLISSSRRRLRRLLRGAQLSAQLSLRTDYFALEPKSRLPVRALVPVVYPVRRAHSK